MGYLEEKPCRGKKTEQKTILAYLRDKKRYFFHEAKIECYF